MYLITSCPDDVIDFCINRSAVLTLYLKVKYTQKRCPYRVIITYSWRELPSICLTTDLGVLGITVHFILD